MSWGSLCALGLFVIGIAALWDGPKPEWSSGKIARELLWALVALLVGSWYLLAHGLQP